MQSIGHDKDGFSPARAFLERRFRYQRILEFDYDKKDQSFLCLKLTSDFQNWERFQYDMAVIFVVCYIPYQLQFLMVEFNVKAFNFWPHRYTFSRIVSTLTCLPSALHPIFYGMMSTFYRKAFIKIFSCRHPN